MPGGALLKSCPGLGDWVSPKPSGPSFLDFIACLLATDCLGDRHTLPGSPISPAGPGQHRPHALQGSPPGAGHTHSWPSCHHTHVTGWAGRFSRARSSLLFLMRGRADCPGRGLVPRGRSRLGFPTSPNSSRAAQAEWDCRTPLRRWILS